MSRDLEKLGDKFDEASEFIDIANETFSLPDNLGEFVTFEKPEFDYEAEQKLYDLEHRKKILEQKDKLGESRQNIAATFHNIEDLSQEELDDIREEVSEPSPDDIESM